MQAHTACRTPPHPPACCSAPPTPAPHPNKTARMSLLIRPSHTPVQLHTPTAAANRHAAKRSGRAAELLKRGSKTQYKAKIHLFQAPLLGRVARVAGRVRHELRVSQVLGVLPRRQKHLEGSTHGQYKGSTVSEPAGNQNGHMVGCCPAAAAGHSRGATGAANQGRSKLIHGRYMSSVTIVKGRRDQAWPGWVMCDMAVIM